MRVEAVLLDLLMAVMNSLDVWSQAAGDRGRGLVWRDGVTRRMAEAGVYVSYDALVDDAAADARLPLVATHRLRQAWRAMEPWPDAAALARLTVPYAFVTNSSTQLASIAAERSGATPRFVLAAEEAGRFKPNPAIYREACRRLGSVPSRTLFVAGSPYDAAGARAAGLRVLLIVRRPDHLAPAGIPAARSLEEVVDQILEVDARSRLEPRW